jgi:uncharacterized protein (DUF697 family)
MEEQRRRFSNVVNSIVALDLTRPEEGFSEPAYGGPVLIESLLDVLPDAQRQTLEAFEAASKNIQEVHARKMLPTILGYSALAASAGAIPVPFVSLLMLPGLQRRMVAALGDSTGRPEAAARFLETAQKLGLGQLRRQAAVELLKIVPYVGAISGAASAGAATYALGKAFAHFDATIRHGSVFDGDELRRYYQEQLERARSTWKKKEAH